MKIFKSRTFKISSRTQLTIYCVLLILISLIMAEVKIVLLTFPLLSGLILWFFKLFNRKRKTARRVLRKFIRETVKDLKASFDLLISLVFSIVLSLVITVLIPYLTINPPEWIFTHRVEIHLTLSVVTVFALFLNSVRKFLEEHRLKSLIHLRMPAVPFLEYWANNLYMLLFAFVLIPGIVLESTFIVEILSVLFLLLIATIYWRYNKTTQLRRVRNLTLTGLIIIQLLFLTIGAVQVEKDDLNVVFQQSVRGIEEFTRYASNANWAFDNFNKEFESIGYIVNWVSLDSRYLYTSLNLQEFNQILDKANQSYQNALVFHNLSMEHFVHSLEACNNVISVSSGVTRSTIEGVQILVETLQARLNTLRKAQEVYLNWARMFFDTTDSSSSVLNITSECLKELKEQDLVLQNIPLLSLLNNAPSIQEVRSNLQFIEINAYLAHTIKMDYSYRSFRENKTSGIFKLSLSNPTDYDLAFWGFSVRLLPETKYQLNWWNETRYYEWEKNHQPVGFVLEPEDSATFYATLECEVSSFSEYEPTLLIDFYLWHNTPSGWRTRQGIFAFDLPSEIIAECKG